MTDAIPYHVVTGSGDTTVFILHGAYGDGGYFGDLAQSLAAKGYRAVVWDCPGYGSSEPVDPPTIESFAAAAIALIQDQGTKTNVLLGHSMGALIGPYATNREARIDGLVLSAGAAGFATRSSEEQKQYVKERLGPIQNGVSVREYAAQQLKHMMAKGVSGKLVDKVVEVVLAMIIEAFATSIRAIMQFDSRPELNAVKKPTLLIAGREDPACTPEGMEKMHKLIAGSEFYVIENAGHYGFAEQPEAYKTILIAWLERNFPIDW